VLTRIGLEEGGAATARITLPAAVELLDVDPGHGVVVASVPTRTGLSLREVGLIDGRARDLLSLNDHFAEVDWGETRLIDYRGADDIH
jgi:hypothetical protein